MGRKTLIVALVWACTVFFFTGSAWATCPDIEGTWDAEVWAGNASGTQHWNQCTLTISPTGLIEPGGTYTDFIGETSDITGGQLTMNGDCEIQGTIETTSGTVSVQRGAISENKLFFDKVAQ